MASDKPNCDDKKDPIKLDSEESPIGSSVDGESGEPGDGEGEGDGTGLANPPEQAPKRKGGRKPIYATTEERKQRNRQAQAAFRERRTEYIKQLEHTIGVHEQTLANLNAAHRTAADECLMLRYKNSLLERILLEKGIDVQAELQAKHGSPNFGPKHMPAMIPPPPISRTLLNRHGSRRSTSSIAPKIESAGTYNQLPPLQPQHVSPKSQRPPAAPSPTEGAFGGPSPASSDGALRLKQQQQQQQMVPPARMMPPAMHQQQQPQMTRMGSGAGGASAASAPFYQTPQYQSHLQQLEQEYDADIMDEQQGQEGEDGPGPYPGAAYASHASAQQQQQQMSPIATTAPGQPPQGMSMANMLDPAMDWDPFGLSASMQFPTSFSFDTSNMR
ncbi:hypothetical protein N0V82_004000 [Gnomoniopsis sp. IMI 355080]|nr:hypothetical protein N0V82_004000 [Gnomoniopsis sp. IMI 355080]